MENIEMTDSNSDIIAEIMGVVRGGKSKDALRKPNSNGSIRHAAQSNIQTAAQLRTKTFAPLKYIVPGLIVEGLVLLAGKPKVRKSWMALDVGLAVAEGRMCLGNKKPQQGSVLYLGLEDGERRLQRRIDKLLPTFGTEWPQKFHYTTQWPRADQGGVEEIDSWCESQPDARLVVIDVLARFRTPANGRANAYAEDYAALAKLQELAIKRSITILVIHHTRKGESEDPAEEISGTLGLSGCADAFLVLKRGAAGATLTGRGRDIEDVDLAVLFSNDACRWTILGEAAEVHRSDQRAAVLAALTNATEGLATAEIMASAGLVSRTAADKLLLRMVEDNQIKRLKRGFYGLPISQSPTPWEKREKGRLESKPLKEQRDSGQSPNLPHLPADEGAARNRPNAEPTVSPDYLGPPRDDPSRCAQCGGTLDGTESPHTICDREVWLHRECEPFWKEGGGWGVRR